jgi:phage terminase large subunit-like protein
LNLDSLSLSEKRELLTLLEEKERRKARNRLADYAPYPKQVEFHSLKKRERALIAANQVGKTVSSGFEVAIHLTGRYPFWWNGRVWTKPVVVIVGSKSGQLLRDGAQRILMGRPGEWGTGAIPGDAIIGEPKRAQGTPDLLDSVQVRHASGGISRVGFKTYDQGRERWQAETVDLIWLDEEPPSDIYFEALTRTNATGGDVMLTLTPLLGMSDVVKRFLMESSDDRGHVSMTIADALHYSAEDRERIIASYPAHERESRAKGVPSLGSGRVFPITEESISWIPTAIPKHWPRICGIDFGWDHPTAAVWTAWDRDSDTVYVTDCYRQRQEGVIAHAAAIRARGECPVSWPHDGLQHDKGSGEQLAEQYRKQGINMLPERATFPDGSNGVEAGVMDMLERMQTGRLKVAAHLAEWWEEFRLYHRKDGKLVKEADDLLSATRYAIMMLRFATVATKAKPIEYPRMAVA